HEGGNTAGTLCVRNRVQGNRGLTGRFRTIDFHHATTRETADTERNIEWDRAGRDHFYRGTLIRAQAHHGTLAELAVNLCQCCFEGLLLVWCRCHRDSFLSHSICPQAVATSGFPGPFDRAVAGLLSTSYGTTED